SDHVLFPPPHPVHRGLLWTQEDPRFGGQCRIGDVADEIPNHVVPNVGKGSDQATHISKRSQFTTTLTQHPPGPPLEVNESQHPGWRSMRASCSAAVASPRSAATSRVAS